MNIEQFRASRRSLVATSKYNPFELEIGAPFNSYADDLLYIDGNESVGWSLVLSNELFDEKPLAELEAILFAYGVESGAIEETLADDFAKTPVAAEIAKIEDPAIAAALGDFVAALSKVPARKVRS